MAVQQASFKRGPEYLELGRIVVIGKPENYVMKLPMLLPNSSMMLKRLECKVALAHRRIVLLRP